MFVPTLIASLLTRGGGGARAQDYIGAPHLINGKKYDMRIYALVSSFDPLRVYIFYEGLVRFATHDYVSLDKDAPVATDPKTGKAVGGKGSAAKARRRCVKDRFMHLTNYSVRTLHVDARARSLAPSLATSLVACFTRSSTMYDSPLTPLLVVPTLLTSLLLCARRR